MSTSGSSSSARTRHGTPRRSARSPTRSGPRLARVNEATLYRFAAHALFTPFGGLTVIRRAAIDALRLRPGTRVLELGCGPGDVTAQLLERGTIVEAVDGSPEMLSAAAARAPAA